MSTGPIKGGIGHNLPQEASQAFAQAVGVGPHLPSGPTCRVCGQHPPCWCRNNTNENWEYVVTQIGKVVYTAKTHTTGGRENGASRSSDGCLDFKLSTPGSARIGTNPEQLFAAGWSACFESAIGLAARKRKITLPADTAIDAEVDLNVADDGYFLSARLNVNLPGVEREVALALVDEAHRICPYSKATRDNIDVAINLV
jgi:Ohr subfamily peroxiredoxin